MLLKTMNSSNFAKNNGMSKIDLKYLSKELNLSVSTISRALRDDWEISEKTKERVRALAEKLNYSPNPYASSLRRQSSQTIAVVMPEIANNFFALVINGIESVAREKNYHVLIYLTHEDYERELSIVNYFQNGRTDGILMSVSVGTQNYAHLLEIHKNGMPIVFFDRVCPEIETTRIITDDFESSFNATEHLIKNGCRRIACLSMTDHLSIETKRKSGYLKALAKYDIPINPDWIVECSNDDPLSISKIRTLLTLSHKPCSIFATVEKLAIHTYDMCKELNINIPKKLKVVTFSNLTTADLLNPSLTTITQPAFEIGKQAATVLFKHLDKKRFAIPNEDIVLKSDLHIRNSTL
jgi:LacI family transcriptional regulator